MRNVKVHCFGNVLIALFSGLVSSAIVVCASDGPSCYRKAFLGEVGGNVRSIPVSRVIERDGKKLFISKKADEQMLQLDDFVKNREIVAEIVATGVVKRIDGEDVLVEMVLPDFQKVLVLEQFFMERRTSNFLEIIARSRRMKIKSDSKGGLLIDSDYKPLAIPVGKNSSEEYTFIEPLLSAVLPNASAKTFDEAVALVAGKESIELNLDFDLIVTGGSVWSRDQYFERIEDTASKLGGKPSYNTHHHPVFGLMHALFAEKTGLERSRAYDGLLEPSLGDLKFMKSNHVGWFEIRALDRQSTGNASGGIQVRSYQLDQIEKIGERLQTGVEQMIEVAVLGRYDTSYFLGGLSAARYQLSAVRELNQDLRSLLTFKLGEKRFADLSEQVEKNSRTDLNSYLLSLFLDPPRSGKVEAFTHPEIVGLLERFDGFGLEKRYLELAKKIAKNEDHEEELISAMYKVVFKYQSDPKKVEENLKKLQAMVRILEKAQ